MLWIEFIIFISDSSSKSSDKKLSDKDNKETTKQNDWSKNCGDRTGSIADNWSVNSMSVIPSLINKSNPSPGTPDRKSCGPLYRMYTKAPPHVTSMRDVNVERDTPKWRFFVKRFSSSYIILTFIPASYRDCKALMLGAEPKACNILSESNSTKNLYQEDLLNFEQTEDERQLVLGSKLNPEAKPFLPVSSVKDSMLSVFNSHSPVSSRGWILDNLESTSTVFDPTSSNLDLQNNSNWELNKGNLDPSSPFRLRARSWEPMKPQSVLKTKKHSTPRERTRSVGSRGKTWSESKLRRKILYDSDVLSVLSNPKTTKTVLGSLNIPVYIYGCSIDNMMDALILKSDYVQDLKDLYWKRNLGPSLEGEFESDEIFEDIEDTEDSPSFKQG